MNHALETLREARDHARHALAQHEDAIARLKADGIDRPMVAAEQACEELSRGQIGIGSTVSLRRSGELGEVIGSAVYSRQPPQYLVEYVTADGRQTEGWFAAEALRPGWTATHHPV